MDYGAEALRSAGLPEMSRRTQVVERCRFAGNARKKFHPWRLEMHSMEHLFELVLFHACPRRNEFQSVFDRPESRYASRGEFARSYARYGGGLNTPIAP